MLQINKLTKHYGAFKAVDNLSISLKKGKFLTLLGPSGSGKSTTLLMIAGFIVPDNGQIKVDGNDVTLMPPYKRNIGMVFQNYALFPHMTVLKNIAFPLKMRHVDKKLRQEKALEMLSLVGLESMGDRLPKQLSGGQQQRVALARALVFNPPLLLMDEPLGALDRQLRQKMQFEIKHIQEKLGITVIYVTHDQEEALTMSDEIAIMNNGQIEQLGSPKSLYEKPDNRFVAEFIGESNLLVGSIVEKKEKEYVIQLDSGNIVVAQSTKTIPNGQNILLSIRPERIEIPINKECVNKVTGRIEEIAYLGESLRFKIKLEESNNTLIVKQPNLSNKTMEALSVEEKIEIGWKIHDGVILDR
jgi:putative spermidine/putrescine transport system ATP-binding protein